MKSDLIRLIAVLGRINPSVWDAIVPHGPGRIAAASGTTRKVSGEPNPQPSSPDHELQVASAGVAGEVAQAAITAQAAGLENAAEMVRKAIAAWCGTPPPPPPIPWPWPEPWPRPWSRHDRELKVDIGASQVVGALTFASIASRMPEGELRDAFTEGAAQLLEVGISA